MLMRAVDAQVALERGFADSVQCSGRHGRGFSQGDDFVGISPSRQSLPVEEFPSSIFPKIKPFARRMFQVRHTVVCVKSVVMVRLNVVAKKCESC
jgi:hypothetical protein